MVSIAIDKPMARLKINEITSIYGRNNAKTFVTNLINDNKVLKVNDKKIKNWLPSIGVQFSKELANSLFIDTSIPQSKNNVKSSTNTRSMQNAQNNTQNEVRSMKTNNKNVSNNNNTQTKVDSSIQQELHNRIQKIIMIVSSKGTLILIIEQKKNFKL